MSTNEALSENVEGRSWVGTLFSYAFRCKGKMLFSLLASVASVAAGFVPFYAVYRIMGMAIAKSLTWDGALIWIALAAVAYILSKILFGISTLLSHVSAYTILESLRKDVVRKLMHASLGTVQTKSIGNIKSVFLDRIENIEPPLAHMIPELGGSLVLAAGLAVWLVLIDWRMALACLVCVPLGLMVFASSLKEFNAKYAAFMAESNHVNSVIVEYVEGIQVVKAFNQASDSYEKYSNAVKAFKDFTMEWFKSTWLTMNLMSSIMPTTLLGVMPVGLALYFNGALSPIDLAMCVVLALAIVDPIARFTSFINEIKSMEYAVADAEEFLGLPELPEVTRNATGVQDSSIELKDVHFSYKEDEEVLHGISLNIPRGSFTALVGPSGSGKSTLARLLVRHWDVDDGSIAIGGGDVRDMPLEQLSELVSFVAQDNYLFDASIRDNIRLGNPSASDEEVEAAARAACCDDFVSRLPQGLDTPAGSAGFELSGGERQRVSIARAILKDAPVVVLDEATAFTDPESEDKIQKSIAHLSSGKALVVIAHRLSTIVNADQIAVIDGGNVIATGKHDTLISTCPLYARMWSAHIGARMWSAGSGEERSK